MFTRIREITDALGCRLRVSIEAHPTGGRLVIERPDRPRQPRLLLDGYGAELLWAYIMNARLAQGQDLPGETVDGHFPTEIELRQTPAPALRLSSEGGGQHLEIPAPMWDRLYAELGLAIPHLREISRRRELSLH